MQIATINSTLRGYQESVLPEKEVVAKGRKKLIA
jgi:hypothetical protein